MINKYNISVIISVVVIKQAEGEEKGQVAYESETQCGCGFRYINDIQSKFDVWTSN